MSSLLAFIGISCLVSGIVCPPGRPLSSVNLDDARHMFKLAATKYGVHDNSLSKNALKSIFNAFDANGDNKISESEVSNYWTAHHYRDLPAVIYLFHRADTDHSGVMEQSPDLDRIFDYFDQNDDGKVSEAEFAIVWVSLSS